MDFPRLKDLFSRTLSLSLDVSCVNKTFLISLLGLFGRVSVMKLRKQSVNMYHSEGATQNWRIYDVNRSSIPGYEKMTRPFDTEERTLPSYCSNISSKG